MLHKVTILGVCTWYGGLFGEYFSFGFLQQSYDVPGQRKKRDTSLDILQTKFASGDITPEEYQQKKIFLKQIWQVSS